ncbi:hypothetical protein DPMN_043122 [Dreissena polymorpha]|uniref:Uncharacterized protein n=1 Tax=Dreissena polymorpha TaxID=45954 RepID=A0A9D4D263_DREPO|nr:hypothetical protein DPMN_043122 [Dreissena polymorpha]
MVKIVWCRSSVSSVSSVCGVEVVWLWLWCRVAGLKWRRSVVVWCRVVWCKLVWFGWCTMVWCTVRNVLFVVWCRACRIVLYRCCLEWCEWSGWCMVWFRVVQCRVCCWCSVERCNWYTWYCVKSVVRDVNVVSGVSGVNYVIESRVMWGLLVVCCAVWCGDWCVMWCRVLWCIMVVDWCKSELCNVMWCRVFRLVLCIVVRCRCCVIWCRVIWCRVSSVLCVMWYRKSVIVLVAIGVMWWKLVWYKVVWCIVVWLVWARSSAICCSPCNRTKISSVILCSSSSVSVVSRQYR